MRNIEIKAKVADIDAVEATAKTMSDKPLTVIKQHDIFFNVTNPQAPIGARLKLRHFEDGSGELIYYLRDDIQGPKLSTYSRIDLNPKQLKEIKEVLTDSNGILGEVQKTRHLYMIGQARIHIDRVAGLGNFMEFEVVLKDEETFEQGDAIAKSLIKSFDLTEESLISGAYLDLLIKQKN